MQLSGFATGGVCARRNIVRISSIAARASVSEPPPAAKPPLRCVQAASDSAIKNGQTKNSMNKMRIITIIALFLLVLSSNAQETLIVRGYLERPNTRASINLQKNMFCYLKGDYIMPEYNSFCTFRVDSVINGSFLNFKNEINQPPFNIMVALINECTILDYRQNYTLQIKQFPHTNYYYIDSLNQISPNEKYLDKLAEYHKNNQQNKRILIEGTLQERHEFLGKLQNYYTSQKTDYRYISYVIPFMASKDTIIDYKYLSWDGWDKKTGKMVGGTEKYEEKELYSDNLYNYLDRILPFVLPDKTTDSIGWHNWFDSIGCSQEFSPIKYAKTEHKTIKTTDGGFGYFIPDISSRKIYFIRNKACILNMDTDEIEEKQVPRNCNSPYPHGDYSIQNNEIPDYNSFNKGIDLLRLDNGVFCRQDDKIIPLNLQYKETPSSSYTYPNLIIHSGNDFIIFTSQNPDGHNYLKAGKINRKGKWIIKPKNLYKKEFQSYVDDTDDIGSFSFCQSDENETIFAFSDKTYSRKSYSAGEKYGKAIIIFKLNVELEVKDSVILTDFSPSYWRFSEINLLKKDRTFLLLAQRGSNRNYQLCYRLLNYDLTPKTEFIKLANNMNGYAVGKPIITSEGFMLSWVDNDLSENVLRSILIEKSGRQSEIINIFNQRIDNIHNIEFDKDNVDIYLFNRDEQTLIRKRIDKKEYGL